MRKDDENVQHTELQSRNGEEVDGDHLADVISKKGHPGLRWLARLLGHPARHRTFRDREPQFFQFTMDARCSPCGIGGRHSVDQLSNLGASPRTTRLFRLRQLPPISFEPIVMPGCYSFRLHEYQRRLPALPNHVQADPK